MHHCPKCGKELGLKDQRGVTDHPKARRLKALAFIVTWWWVGLLTVAFLVICFMPADRIGPDRGIGWMVAFLPFIPGFTLHVASWFFPRVRIWFCADCQHRCEQSLE